MRSEPVRQNKIADYMYQHGMNNGYTTREIATMMDTTTNAILSGLKRMRKAGRVFHHQNKWYLTGSEKMNQEGFGKDQSATEANTSSG